MKYILLRAHEMVLSDWQSPLRPPQTGTSHEMQLPNRTTQLVSENRCYALEHVREEALTIGLTACVNVVSSLSHLWYLFLVNTRLICFDRLVNNRLQK